MQGLIRRINFCGGLTAMSHPQPYIKRLLIWIDSKTVKTCRLHTASLKQEERTVGTRVLSCWNNGKMTALRLQGAFRISPDGYRYLHLPMRTGMHASPFSQVQLFVRCRTVVSHWAYHRSPVNLQSVRLADCQSCKLLQTRVVHRAMLHTWCFCAFSCNDLVGLGIGQRKEGPILAANRFDVTPHT